MPQLIITYLRAKNNSRASFIYQNCLSNYKTMCYSTDIISKHSYFPPPLEENFNVLEHYLQRGKCLCTLEIMSMQWNSWQKIITLIPCPISDNVLKGI